MALVSVAGTRKRPSPAALMAGFAAVIAFVLTAVRLFYGVDFTDEAIYAIIPYRFALGAKPFVDEMLFHQTSALFTYPVVKLFQAVTGGPTGIILFLRFVWLAAMSGVAAVVWSSLRGKLAAAASVLVALPCVAFIFGAIPALSYNTLGFAFMTVGFFIAYRSVTEEKPNLLYLAGVFHACAVAVYPSLAVAVVVFAVSLLFVAKKPAAVLRYAAGGAVIAVLFAAAFVIAGAGNVISSYRMTSSIGAYGGGLRKFGDILKALWVNYSGKKLFLAVALIIWLGRKANPKAAWLLAASLPLFALSFGGFPGNLFSTGYVTYLFFLGPVFYLLSRRDKAAGVLFWLIWLPSLAAGLATSLTSSNGYWAAAVGLFPGMLATLALMRLALIALRPETDGRVSAIAVIALMVPLIVFVGAQFTTRAYGDDSPADLTARVTTGGYAGLYTTYGKLAYLENLQRDLRSASAGARTVMFFDAFPGGYLLTDLKPLTNLAWVPPSEYFYHVDRGMIMDYYGVKRAYPDLVVKLNVIYYSYDNQHVLLYPKADPLEPLVTGSRFRPAATREDYTIYRNRGLSEQVNK